MITRKTAVVFGGSGFIGRYIVKRLAARGYVVRVAVRNTEGAIFLKTAGAVGQIVPLYAPLGSEADVARAVADAEVVVNATGILNERRRGDFTLVHEQGAGRVARLAARAGVKHLVHISAIGADARSTSLYGRSKAAGERAVASGFPKAIILRPSIVFGPEDDFFNRFAGMAALFPVIPIAGAATKFQPVFVADVAEAAMAAMARPDAEGQVFELGGPEIKTFRELIGLVLKITGRNRWVWNMPNGVARLQASVLQHLPGQLLTPDQLNMLATDNVAAPGAPGLAALGVSATPMELQLPSYLTRFRCGGKQQEHP